MKTSYPILGAALLVAALPAAARKTDRPALPNIVYFMADDMGIGDLGCYGSTKIHTPNIDALCSQSLKFTRHYAGSTVSAPSRCCLMTGKHTGHSWVRGNKAVVTPEGRFDTPIPSGELTVAEVLKSKGYATMCVGKWGLGGPGTEGSPIKQGFDYFCGYLSQSAAHRYYPEYIYENERKVYLGEKVYSHHLFMDKGMEFIEKHAGQPFFAYFSVTPPHADLDYPDLSEYEGAFKEKPYKNTLKDGHGYKGQETPAAAYASMVTELDRNVGRIRAFLEEKGLWENTIFIFTSDNGVHLVGGHNPDYFNSNGPFRGYKRDLYEGGVRVPFILSWPAVIKEHRETDEICTFWDFLPTVADIIGSGMVEETDGISYLPVILGKDKKHRQHEYIYYEFYEGGGKQSILKDGWKLVRLFMSRPDKQKDELYHLDEDPAEEHDLIGEYPEIADRLRELAGSARTESTIFRW